MPDSINSTRLLFNLHQGAEIAQNFSGLEPKAIAHQLTEGLVEKFGIALSRVWLLETNQQVLKLVSSSGMYTHTDGFFSQVSLGAYKVGKIAQNKISFLSNNLAEELWVGNREWAIANNINGFAGYPLMIRGKVLGVLANFSHSPLTPEFLEALQTLCMMTSISLDTALRHQQTKQMWSSTSLNSSPIQLPLSEQLAAVLTSTRLTLVGAEQMLSLPIMYVFLQTAEILNRLGCAYCRLSYQANSVDLEAIAPIDPAIQGVQPSQVQPNDHDFSELFLITSCLGGTLNTQLLDTQRSIQISLMIPYPNCKLTQRIRIKCQSSVLRIAFTHIAYLAGLAVNHDWQVAANLESADSLIPLLTDDITQIYSSKYIIWIQQVNQPIPLGIQAKVDLTTTPEQLREAVETVIRGEVWGIESSQKMWLALSERELEIMRLLADGLRDRMIAKQLVISESTVKFHINNILAKLKAKTRFQALYQVMSNHQLLS